MRYLNARLSENKSYVDTENPDSSTNNFTTLSKQINNIVDYDIPNVKAYVIEGWDCKGCFPADQHSVTPSKI